MIGFETNLTLKKVAAIIGATLPKSLESAGAVNRLLTQSVYVNPGDVVISAGWYPRITTVKESLEKGALAVFCDLETKTHFKQENVIGVADPLKCVVDFETWRAKECKAIRIAITGSVGKTTTTGLINSVIANSFNTLTHHTMANSHGAILRNVQRLNKRHEYWVQEVGGVQPGYIESSAVFLQPDIVVLTNIGESHLNLYGTKENIFRDKSSLERFAKPDGVVIINSDDEILANAEYTHRVIRCSLENKDADYYAYDIRTDTDGLHFTVSAGEEEAQVHLNLFGDYNAYNALFAVACGKLAGLDLGTIVKLMETYQPSGMRQNLVKVGGYSFLLDSFNAEPKTVLGSAKTLASMPVSEKGRRIFVTGHIDKLGDDSPQMHEQLGRELGELDLDIIVLFAGDSVYTYEGIKSTGYNNAILMHSRDELDEWLTKNLTRDDIVFFKSGQFEAALAKTVDHVFGTTFQNEQQFNEGKPFEENGFKFRLRQDKIAEVEGYSGNETDIVIPETVNGHIVTRISPRAFTRHYNITSLVIPDSVKTIGQEAFYICPKLKTIKLPKSLKYIGNNAFNYCKQLEVASIPDGVIHLGRRAFFDCMALKSITIPKTVGFLGESVLDVEKPLEERPLLVHVEKESYAEDYCKNNNLPYCFVPHNDNLSYADKRLLERANYWKKMFNNRVSKKIDLTDVQKAEILSYWGKYQDLFEVDTVFHLFYYEKTGVYDPRIMPFDLYYCFVEPYFNDWKTAPTIDNKCLYSKLFKDAAQPETVFSRVNRIWTNGNGELISRDGIEEVLSASDELVIKQANDSEGGSNIFFISGDDIISKFDNACDSIKKDLIVQKAIHQHQAISTVYPYAINTIRIMTLLSQEEVKICSAIIRMGIGNMRVDNVSKGGLSCGIQPDGRLKSVAYNYKGEKFYEHPTTGVSFDSVVIPSFDKACKMVRRIHPAVPNYRLISWDIAIDEDANPLLVEANLFYGALNVHQMNNGPVFGDYTQDILDEVFPKE